MFVKSTGHRALIVAASVCVSLGGDAPMAGATDWISSEPGDWHDAANWSDGVPDSGTSVTFYETNYEPELVNGPHIVNLTDDADTRQFRSNAHTQFNMGTHSLTLHHRWFPGETAGPPSDQSFIGDPVSNPNDRASLVMNDLIATGRGGSDNRTNVEHVNWTVNTANWRVNVGTSAGPHTEFRVGQGAALDADRIFMNYSSSTGPSTAHFIVEDGGEAYFDRRVVLNHLSFTEPGHARLTVDTGGRFEIGGSDDYGLLANTAHADVFVEIGDGQVISEAPILLNQGADEGQGHLEITLSDAHEAGNAPLLVRTGGFVQLQEAILNLAVTGSFSAEAGDVFNIVAGLPSEGFDPDTGEPVLTSGIAGQFAGLEEGDLVSADGAANPFQISYEGQVAFGGEQMDAVTLTYIPEPGSLALLGIGATWLVCRGRRRDDG